MSGLPGWVRALLVGRFLNAVGSLAWLFVPLYLTSARGFSEGAAGAVAAAYGVGLIAGNLAGGSVGDRLGLRRTLAGASIGSALGCLLVPVVPDAALAPLLVALGAVGGVGRPVSFALVTAALPVADRRSATAWLRAVNNAGTVIGPPVGGLLAAWHFSAVFALDAASSLLMLAVVLAVVPTSPRPVLDPDAPRTVLAALRADHRMVLLLATVLVTDTAYRFAYTAMPWQLAADGAAPWVYGTTISLNCVLIVLLEPWLAHRLRGRPPELLIGAGFALVGLGWSVLAPAQSVVLALVAVAVVTAGEMLYKPTATAHAADRAPAGMHGRYQSLYGAASLGGTVLAPPLAGWLIEHGHTATWAVGAVLPALAAAVLLGRWGRRPVTAGA
ncbi:MAG: MFS transporter [Marmoricola sp.]